MEELFHLSHGRSINVLISIKFIALYDGMVRIIYTKHALEKFKELENKGWIVTKTKIKEIIKEPKWRGTTKYKQETALGLMDEKHILRIVLNRKGDIIKVITFHIGRRGKYESTL